MDASEVKTVLYAASVAPLADSRVFNAAYNAVSPRRREKVDRYRFAEDKYLSLCAGLLLSYGLCNAGVDEAKYDFVYGANEKPYLDNSNIYFSLSHSHEYAACAVSGYEVGCDIEKIAPVNLKVARRFFCQEEYEDIAQQPTSKERDEMFFRYWTLKESFIKATGSGLSIPLDSFRIVRGEKISVIQSVDLRSYGFAEFQDVEGYKCSVCFAGNCGKAEFKIIDLKELLSLK